MKAVVLESNEDGTPRVEAVVYPHPAYEGNPWSQWGQGVVVGDGRFLSAIGDHLGADGNSYLYEYDPSTATITQIADVLSMVDHTPGAWGYGKVHGQMVPDHCGNVIFATYWGSRNGLSYEDTYAGDWLLRWDPSTHSVTPLTVPSPGHGIPSLAGWSSEGLLYGEAVNPLSNNGEFFVYDITANEVVVHESEVSHAGFRNILVVGAGRALFSAGDSRLQIYDPATGAIALHRDPLPGFSLRASTRPSTDGTVYGVTQDPAVVFTLAPSGGIRPLGPARGYVTSLALSADDSTLFYVPDAHGSSWKQGTPVIAIDVETGRDSVLLELNELSVTKLGLRLGGSYNVASDPTGEYLFIGFNAGSAGRESFGEVVLVIIHLP